MTLIRCNSFKLRGMTAIHIIKYRLDERHKLAEYTPADAFLVFPLMVCDLYILFQPSVFRTALAWGSYRRCCALGVGPNRQKIFGNSICCIVLSRFRFLDVVRISGENPARAISHVRTGCFSLRCILSRSSWTAFYQSQKPMLHLLFAGRQGSRRQPSLSSAHMRVKCTCISVGKISYS
jgi:hypothetical protein